MTGPIGALLLELRDLTKSYPTQAGDPILAVAGVSLALADAEFVSLVGPSGCGKSTLLKMLAGVIAPTAGDIVFGGAVVHGAQDGMGVVFQSPVLLPWLTVIENVLLPIKILGQDRAAAEQRAHALLALVGLGALGLRRLQDPETRRRLDVWLLQTRFPGWGIAFDVDPAAAAATRRRVFDMAAADRLAGSYRLAISSSATALSRSFAASCFFASIGWASTANSSPNSTRNHRRIRSSEMLIVFPKISAAGSSTRIPPATLTKTSWL